jgi:hypothetical protein
LALATVTLALSGAPALADAGNFTIVNGTGEPISAVAIRRFGSDQWRPLSAAPAAGARAAVLFSDPDCVFDFRATMTDGKTQIWRGVNLCGAKTVSLNRAASGALWVDYD